MTDDWTPDQPLPNDATDEQIEARHNRVWWKSGDTGSWISVCVARELQAATSAEYEAKLAALEAKYTELLYAVAQKFVGESRHETALRYIREREIAATQSSPNAA